MFLEASNEGCGSKYTVASWPISGVGLLENARVTGIGDAMILQSPIGNIAPRFNFPRTVLLGVGFALLMPFAAKADCTFGGPIGPGGAQFHSFLAATSNAATSTVTAMNTGFQTQTTAFISSPSSS